MPSLRFLSNLAIIHLSHSVAGFGLIEMRGCAGNQTPRHVHRAESEGFFVLNGELRVEVGNRTVHLGPGQSTLAGAGVPHTLVVESGNPARWLVITNGEFDRFVSTVAAPADRTRPGPPESLKDVAARFGIEILDPAPGAEDLRLAGSG